MFDFLPPLAVTIIFAETSVLYTEVNSLCFYIYKNDKTIEKNRNEKNEGR